MKLKKNVEAGRIDETLDAGPRCCGDEWSASDLVKEVMHLFLSCVDRRNIFEGLITDRRASNAWLNDSTNVATGYPNMIVHPPSNVS